MQLLEGLEEQEEEVEDQLLVDQVVVANQQVEELLVGLVGLLVVYLLQMVDQVVEGEGLRLVVEEAVVVELPRLVVEEE